MGTAKMSWHGQQYEIVRGNMLDLVVERYSKSKTRDEEEIRCRRTGKMRN